MYWMLTVLPSGDDVNVSVVTVRPVDGAISSVSHIAMKPISPSNCARDSALFARSISSSRLATSSAAGHDELHNLLERPAERRAGAWVAAVFMLLVGLSLPQIFEGDDMQHPEPTAASLHASAPGASVDDPALAGGEIEGRYVDTVTASQPSISWGAIAAHVLLLSALINVGKMFPVFCYRKEAHWKHRLAIAVGMWPRGEVGAGVLVLSLSYGIGGPIVTVAMLSLALNLLLTGVFIIIVKRLIGAGDDAAPAADAAASATQ